MVKKVILKANLLNFLDKAMLMNDYVEVTYGKGIVIIQSKNLQCVECGCTDESKLIVRNGVHICTECLNEMKEFADRTEVL